jgi:hypothetical protein
MSMYVAARHRIFRGAGNVFCIRATSTMTVQAMQTYIVIDVAFFSLSTPSSGMYPCFTQHPQRHAHLK